MDFIFYAKMIGRHYNEPMKFVNTIKTLFQSRSTDTFVVSWHKTGRTWLAFMLGKVLIEKYGIDESKLLYTYEMTKKLPTENIMFTHGGPGHHSDTNDYRNLHFNASRYGKKKIVFLIRDVRDTTVSGFFQMTERSGGFEGDIHDFVRDGRWGSPKIISFYNLWYRNRKNVADFLLIRYEDMHKDPEKELRRLLDFLNIKDVDDSIIQNAISFSSFNNMKKIETEDKFKGGRLRYQKKTNAESRKVRKGKAGGFVEYLNKEDLKYIDDMIDELQEDGCDWYKAL